MRANHLTPRREIGTDEADRAYALAIEKADREWLSANAAAFARSPKDYEADDRGYTARAEARVEAHRKARAALTKAAPEGVLAS
jgi:hypothetical protein